MEMQKREAERFVSVQEKNRRQDAEVKNALSEPYPLTALMPKRGLEPPHPCGY
jgi:hypothetical protein